MIPTPTPLAFALPRRYLDTDAVADLDIDAYADRFKYEPDGWNGARDILQPVAETVRTEAGDCEDFAYVAASWLFAQDESPIHIACLFASWGGVPVPRHIVAVGPKRVYSSGVVFEQSLAAYRRQSEFRWAISRRVK